MKALIVVDAQNDFMSGVKGNASSRWILDSVINPILCKFPLVIFTRRSYSVSGADVVDLPLDKKFCVDGTWGEYPAEDLKMENIPGGLYFFKLGTGEMIFKTHSAFSDRAEDNLSGEEAEDTGLQNLLDDRGVTEVYIAGKNEGGLLINTALDSVACGYDTNIIIPDSIENLQEIGIYEEDLADLFLNDIKLLSRSNIDLFELTNRTSNKVEEISL